MMNKDSKHRSAVIQKIKTVSNNNNHGINIKPKKRKKSHTSTTEYTKKIAHIIRFCYTLLSVNKIIMLLSLDETENESVSFSFWPRMFHLCIFLPNFLIFGKSSRIPLSFVSEMAVIV